MLKTVQYCMYCTVLLPEDFFLPSKFRTVHHHHQMKQYTEEDILAALEAVVNGAGIREASLS
jgi:hypothetical protein